MKTSIKFRLAAIMLSVAAATLPGCQGIVNVEALGDLSTLGDCELPTGYTAYLLTEIRTGDMKHECPLDGQDVIIRVLPEPLAMCTTQGCEEGDCCNGCEGGFQIPWGGGDLQSISLWATDEFDISYEATVGSSSRDVCSQSCTGIKCDREHIIWGQYHCSVFGEWNNDPYYGHEIYVKGACPL